MSSTRERGEGKVGCFLSLVAMVVAGGLAVKLVPVYYSNSNLASFASDVANQAAFYSTDAMLARLQGKAQELGIPEAQAEGAISLKVNGTKSGGTCTINLDYSRTVDLYGIYSLTIATRKTVTEPYMDAR
jgi:type II secretory pathway pseudopilin PulG